MSKLLLVILFLFFISHTLYSQSIDEVSNLMKNLSTSYPMVFHHTVLSATSSSPYIQKKEKFWSAELQATMSSSNILRFLAPDKKLGTLLGEEQLYGTLMLGLAFKQWDSLPLILSFYGSGILLRDETQGMGIRVIDLSTSAHYLLYTQNGLTPSLSIGFTYAYTFFAFQYTLSQIEFSGIDRTDSEVIIKIKAPELEFSTHTHSLAPRIIASYSWNIIEPFFGVEPSLLISSVHIATDSTIEISRDDGVSFSPHSTLNDISYDFLKEKNLIHTGTAVNLALRLFLGTSVHISSSIYLEGHIAYDPIHQLVINNIGLRMLW